MVDWHRLKELHAQATDLPADERSAFALANCDDAELLRELLELLAHDGDDSGFLDSPLAAESTPTTIAGYRLGRVLGSGGMGTVYEAHQESPHRTVALKVLHPLAMSDSIKRRFVVEAEILARLQHPAIAQVFAAGTHDHGGTALPWFAMELVPEAVPLTTWCARQRLTLSERVELFEEVCDAVHHGHEQGVIHRDLKPGNVLVASSGQPKVIDFGVARVTDADIERATLRTTVGELIGTLAYMSPEQCRAEPSGLDRRSDVHALGVMLYELLTGRLPYETDGLTLPAAIDVITTSAPRRAREIPADLEAVVLKALEKEPCRRYGSAAALAADLQRFQRREPITARPPTLTYHLRLLALRHRALVAAAGAILVVLVAATAVSSVFAVEAAERADEATGERDAAVETLAILEGAVKAANPFVEQRAVTVGELMDGVASRLDRGEVARADVRMRLHRQVGATYRGLGQPAKAMRHLEAARELLPQLTGDRRRDLVDILDLLAATHADRGEAKVAAELIVEAIDVIEEAFGPGAADLVALLASHGSYLNALQRNDEAIASLERAIAIGRAIREPSPLIDSGLAQACGNLGTMRWQAGDRDAAAELWEESLTRFDRSLSPDHPLAARTRSNYGLYLQMQKRHAEAEAMFTGARDLLGRLRGPESPDVANAELKLGFLFVDTGDHERAEQAFRRAIAIRRQCFGGDARQVPAALQGLAYLFLQQQRWADAVELLDEALELSAAGLADDHPALAGTRVLLGRALTNAGDADAAEPHLRRSLEVRRAAFPDGDIRIATAASALGHCLLRRKQLEAAEELLRPSLATIERAVGSAHPEARAARERLAEWCDVAGNGDEAAALRARN